MTGDLRAYQARYHRGDRSALAQLYAGIVKAAEPTCWVLAGPLDADRVAALCHDAATRIVERYLRHDRYRIKSFGAAIRLEVIHALTEGGHNDRPTRKYLHRASALTPDIEAKVNARTTGDPATYLQDLLTEHARGPEVILALVGGTTYPKAVRAIAQLVSRQWIYDHAVKLRYVWKLTRRRRGKDDGVHDAGRCGRGGDEEAMQAVQADLQRRRKRAAARILRDRRDGRT